MYDRMQEKPRFVKIKSHLIEDPIAACHKGGTVQHILLNEAADKAADKPTEGYGTLYASLKDNVEADDRVVAKQARICRRLATVEKHIRKVFGPGHC